MRNFKKFGINNLHVATFLLFLIPIASSPVIASPDQFIRAVGEEAITGDEAIGIKNNKKVATYKLFIPNFLKARIEIFL